MELVDIIGSLLMVNGSISSLNKFIWNEFDKLSLLNQIKAKYNTIIGKR